MANTKFVEAVERLISNMKKLFEASDNESISLWLLAAISSYDEMRRSPQGGDEPYYFEYSDWDSIEEVYAGLVEQVPTRVIRKVYRELRDQVANPDIPIDEDWDIEEWRQAHALRLGIFLGEMRRIRPKLAL